MKIKELLSTEIITTKGCLLLANGCFGALLSMCVGAVIVTKTEAKKTEKLLAEKKRKQETLIKLYSHH